MGIYKLVLPKMGESVSEATITKWVKRIGDFVQEDEAVVEIATDKVDSDVPAPVEGKLVKLCFSENEVVQVGEVIAWLEVDGDTGAEDVVGEDATTGETGAIDTTDEETALEQDGDVLPQDSIPGADLLEVRAEERPIFQGGARFYSPLVKSIAHEEGLTQSELDKIPGSGAEGRVTKQDILDYLRTRGTAAGSSVAQNDGPGGEKASTVQPPEPLPSSTPTFSAAGDEIIEMDRMRRLIADHMVNSVKTSPHVASFVEADVTHLVNWRNRIKDSYKKREGENITFTPIFIEAVSKALKDFPMVNVSVDGHRIIKRKNINIGMATALPSGNLIVPVIKNADQLSLVGLSKAVNDLATRSRLNKLKPDDTQGGTFTFSNIGAFGNIMGVPIINQPQAAILAVGTIKKRPAVLETEHGDVIAIRHMMYLSMSYDHRVIDGALGGTFLKRVADYLENWDINREI
ncbi:MAG TPA: dihydrolipoamide acetyltransferase family protein [Sphingobacterium sp.]|nr:dihydrolipoamide acetyltransferase family protein [Sphingobacterium sp.]